MIADCRAQLELEEPTPQGCFSPGQYVEVRQEEVDFEGSYYSADLLSIEVKAHISSLSRLMQLPCIPPTPDPKCCNARLNLTADQLSFASLQEEVAVVRYHAFEEEDNPNVKLTDKVAVRQIRPRPPATPVDFVSSVVPGVPSPTPSALLSNSPYRIRTIPARIIRP